MSKRDTEILDEILTALNDLTKTVKSLKRQYTPEVSAVIGYPQSISWSTELREIQSTDLGTTTAMLRVMQDKAGCRIVRDLLPYAEPLTSEEAKYVLEPPYVKARTIRTMGIARTLAMLDLIRQAEAAS